MTPQQFRKKPVIVEAMQLTEEAFTVEHPSDLHIIGVVYDLKHRCAFIETLEGRMRANIGDWIIRGVAGELYPCKPEIFEATYEPFMTPDEAWEKLVQRRVAELAAYEAMELNPLDAHFGDVLGQVQGLTSKHHFDKPCEVKPEPTRCTCEAFALGEGTVPGFQRHAFDGSPCNTLPVVFPTTNELLDGDALEMWSGCAGSKCRARFTHPMTGEDYACTIANGDRFHTSGYHLNATDRLSGWRVLVRWADDKFAIPLIAEVERLTPKDSVCDYCKEPVESDDDFPEMWRHKIGRYYDHTFPGSDYRNPRASATVNGSVFVPTKEG